MQSILFSSHYHTNVINFYLISHPILALMKKNADILFFSECVLNSVYIIITINKAKQLFMSFASHSMHAMSNTIPFHFISSLSFCSYTKLDIEILRLKWCVIKSEYFHAMTTFLIAFQSNFVLLMYFYSVVNDAKRSDPFHVYTHRFFRFQKVLNTFLFSFYWNLIEFRRILISFFFLFCFDSTKSLNSKV